MSQEEAQPRSPRREGPSPSEKRRELELPAAPRAGHIRVFLVCDTGLLLAGLGRVYARWPRVEVVGSLDSPEDGCELAADARPDVVVLDFRRAGAVELEQVSRWKSGVGGRLLLVRSESQVAPLRKIFEAGADGVLAQEAQPREVYLALELLAAGHTFLSPRLRQHPFRRSLSDPLSCDLLRLLALGLTPKEITEELELEPTEFSRRKEELLLQLGSPAPTELTRLAIREGLLPKVPSDRLAR